MTKNDITGDNLISRTSNEQYRSGWDSIDWSNKNTTKNEVIEESKENEDGNNA